MQNWHWLVVTDAERRARLADCYRRGVQIYADLPIAAHNLPFEDAERRALQMRILESALYLTEHYHEVPVMVVPCITPRATAVHLEAPGVSERTMHDWVDVSLYGSILPAVWSFQLALRARGLGSCWTTIHGLFERDAAEVLELPYEEVQQIGLVCLGWARTSRFRPAPREPLEQHLHRDRW